MRQRLRRYGCRAVPWLGVAFWGVGLTVQLGAVLLHARGEGANGCVASSIVDAMATVCAEPLVVNGAALCTTACSSIALGWFFAGRHVSPAAYLPRLLCYATVAALTTWGLWQMVDGGVWGSEAWFAHRSFDDMRLLLNVGCLGCLASAVIGAQWSDRAH